MSTPTIQGNMLTQADTCEPCTEYVYSPKNTFTETVISQFNWVCDFSFFPSNSISTAIFMMGLLVGAVGFGYLSDRIGRKNGLMVASICSFITNAALFFDRDKNTFWTEISIIQIQTTKRVTVTTGNYVNLVI